MHYEDKGHEIKHRGDIASRIASANVFKKNFGETFLQDAVLKNLLYQLDKHIEATREEMNAAGVVRECTEYAINGRGSCCGAGMEEKYDEMFLLINLLLGRTLPDAAPDNSSCYFLTDKGCMFSARQLICVNYLCPRLYKNIPHEKSILLKDIAGKELHSLFILQEYIKKKIRELSSSV